MDKAAAQYQEILADGFVARWATTADAAAVEHVCASVFCDPATGALHPQIITYLQGILGGAHPYGKAADVAIVVDPAGTVVSAVVLMRMPLIADGLRITVGRPEMVVSREAVRNRGYMRVLFAMIHARSSAYGDVFQAISGIPYFFRQFGYEYALSLGGSHIYPFDAIPRLPAGQDEPFSLRPATHADIEALVEYHRAGAEMLRGGRRPFLYSAIDRAYWEFVLSPAAAATTWLPYLITDQTGQIVGSIGVGQFRYSEQLEFYYCNTCVALDMQLLAPSLLRNLAAIAEQVAHAGAGVPACRALRANMGVDHPLHAALAHVVHQEETPYAWSVRVPSPAALLNALAPVLERRLNAKGMSAFQQPVVVSFYRGGVTLSYVDGHFTATDTDSIVGAQASYPAGLFAQQVLGFKSLQELMAMHMDVRVDPSVRILLDTLLPVQPSWVTPVD